MTQEFLSAQSRLILSNIDRTVSTEKPDDERPLPDGPVTNGLTVPIVVDTALDVVDPNDGLTSLREAITLANSMSDSDEIRFDASIANSTIRLTSALTITENVTIDGDINGDGIADILISGDVDVNDNVRSFALAPGISRNITNVASNTNDSDNVRLFAINGATTSASLSNLVLTGGVNATGGGGLNVFYASVTL
ncbi:MAG: hypothetical protein AAGL18_09640, partial [Pseudomonadota bacterium]